MQKNTQKIINDRFPDFLVTDGQLLSTNHVEKIVGKRVEDSSKYGDCHEWFNLMHKIEASPPLI